MGERVKQLGAMPYMGERVKQLGAIPN